jgi:hypothetical protein
MTEAGAMRKIAVADFWRELKAQGVKSRADLAFRCPVCKTIQSGRSLIKAGAGKTFSHVEKYVGFSCVGRFTNAGAWKKDEPPGRGCNWTLGGLLQVHELTVVTPDGQLHPRFEIATPEEAKALAEKHASERAAAWETPINCATNPWHPITDSVDLKHLGKLGEELGELGAAAGKCAAAVSRCIIQGIDEREPVTGKLNREWLQDEIADVQANIDLVVERFALDEQAMEERAAKKRRHLKQWHDLAWNSQNLFPFRKQRKRLCGLASPNLKENWTDRKRQT